MGFLRQATNFVPLLVIKFYRKFLSPMFPPACRFHPSCSAYGLEVFQTHPIHKAVWLTCWRIMRCNPFNPGGYDPPPLPNGQKHDPCCEDCEESLAQEDQADG